MKFLPRLRGSLKLRLGITIILGVGIATLVFFGVRFGFNRYIEESYLSEENRASREKNYLDDLQSYVNANGVSSDKAVYFQRWATAQKYVYLMIYSDDRLLYSSDMEIEEEEKEAGDESTVPDANNPGGENPEEPEGGEDTEKDKTEQEKPPASPGSLTGSKYPTYEELKDYARERGMHPITTKDGAVLASIADFTEYLYYDISNVASLLAAMLIFAIIIATFFARIMVRITRLASDVNKVADGDMGYVIRSRGKDELSRLSANVENMRSSIIENLEREREARNANEELITSMSHDIRTPLTVLLGYIDVMKLRCEDEAMDGYIKASEKMALRLKKLSDDMFNYFLVFGNRADGIEMSRYDAKTLFSQMLDEHILLLCENGFSVELTGTDALVGVEIETDAPKMARIIDNIFSNLYKYADPAESIKIPVIITDGEITLSFVNKIKQSAGDVESNGIGLKTCSKIAALLGIRFEYGENDGAYRSVISLPIKSELQKQLKAPKEHKNDL